MTMYERIRLLRINAGMSQEDLAHAMGYKDRSMITKIESGKIDISQKKIIAFAKVLNTSTAYLMGLKDDPAQDYILNVTALDSSPHTQEARIISGGIDKMPKERREQALKILQIAFSEYADYFKEGPDDDA